MTRSAKRVQKRALIRKARFKRALTVAMMRLVDRLLGPDARDEVREREKRKAALWVSRGAKRGVVIDPG